LINKVKQANKTKTAPAKDKIVIVLMINKCKFLMFVYLVNNYSQY